MAKGQVKQKQITINQQTFESLCHIQCTQEEICSVLNVCTDTLDSWCKDKYGKHFSEIFKEKREGGKVSLRRMQWKMAEKNATMGIWLGKQYLDQKDKIETNNYNINNQIENIANLLNNPEPNRSEKDV